MDELQNIQNLIYVIRGQRVMLDFDLAKIYQVETKYLKRQVRRNIERFEGDDFMFEVSQEEILRCQNVTSSWGGSRYGAFAFTEIGVAMLSGVLNSKAQLDALSDALAELQSLKSQNVISNPRKPIGFILSEDDDDKK